MDEQFVIDFEFVVNVEMFDLMLLFEFEHYFQFVQQYHEHFVRILQNDYEMIYEIHINVRFHEAIKINTNDGYS
jgi:hypothetical protein